MFRLKFKIDGEDTKSILFTDGEKAYIKHNDELIEANLDSERVTVQLNFIVLIDAFKFSAMVGKPGEDLIEVQDVIFGNQTKARKEMEAYVLSGNEIVRLENVDSIYMSIGNEDFEFCSSCLGTGEAHGETCLDCGGDGVLY